MKKIISVIMVLLFSVMLTSGVTCIEIKEPSLDLNVKSAVLMDANTGTVLYSQNANEALPPASVTKVMTLLLIFEAIDKGIVNYTDKLTVSENASSMGGSQIFLEPGEQMSVEDLLKSVIIASANDAAVTLAEHVGGSEEEFVSMMNKRASELNLTNTNFENVTGLDDTTINHLTCAKDIALMSRELIKYPKVSQYATIWMDTVRNGEFGLTNTNRLIRYYRGITGLKTGYTSGAGYCVSATARRGDLELIAVIMGAESSEIRNSCATKLLDYGFATYSIYQNHNNDIINLPVYSGKQDNVELKIEDYSTLINKGTESKIEKEIVLDSYLTAPVKKNEIVGKILYKLNGEVVGESNIISTQTIDKLSFFGYVAKILKNFF